MRLEQRSISPAVAGSVIRENSCNSWAIKKVREPCGLQPRAFVSLEYTRQITTGSLPAPIRAHPCSSVENTLPAVAGSIIRENSCNSWAIKKAREPCGLPQRARGSPKLAQPLSFSSSLALSLLRRSRPIRAHPCSSVEITWPAVAGSVIRENSCNSWENHNSFDKKRPVLF